MAVEALSRHTPDAPTQNRSVELALEGMTCGGCVAAVERVLSALDGVCKVAVSLERAEAAVEFDRARVAESALAAAVEDAGYDVAA